MAVASVATQVRTFLIADVRGYSRFTFERGDEAAARLASRFAEITREVVAGQGGEVIELRGDEALAVFASARAALRAGVELQARFATEAEADPDLPLRVGVGLDAGEAIPVDGGYRGTALNLAARLCSLAAAGEVLASDAVVHLARRVEGLDYADRGKMELKGFADPVPIVQVTKQAPKPDAPAVEAVPEQLPAIPIGGFLGALPPGSLVARDRELESVLEAVEAVVAGQGQLVLLAGEPGAGKTRLAQEVTLNVRNRRFYVATGRCYEPEETVPFYPFVEALEALVAQAPAEMRREIGKQWPYLERLLGQGDVSGHGAGQDDQQRLFRAVTGFIQALARTAPVAILLDDLHWADGSSLKLLQYLARHTRADRVLLLGTYRDVEVGRQHPLERALLDLGRERLILRIDVQRLDQEGTAQVMAVTMGESEISDEFASLVHRRTDGNPFFIEEVMRALVERGDIFREENRWGRREVDEIEVPESIRSVIGQRLSALRETTQEILREASILGQTFAFDELEALTERSEDEIEAALEEAEGAGLVRPVRGETYIFKHALTQQTLMSELSPRRRRRLHLAAGEALERLPERKREQRAAELAQHFLDADDPERALPWSILAGEQAAAIFAYSEAESHYRTAVDLARELGDRAQEARALTGLGQVLHSLGHLSDAILSLEESARRYLDLGDRAGEARALAALGRVHSDHGTNDEGIARLQPMLEELSATPAVSGEVGELEVVLGHLYWRSGRYEESAEHAGKASEIARELGDDDLLMEAEWRRGTALLSIRPEEGRETLEAVLGMTERSGNILLLGYALANLASSYFESGQTRRASELTRRAHEAALRIGVPGPIIFAISNVAGYLFLDGKLPEARTMLDEVIPMAADMGPSWQGTYIDYRLGRLMAFQGQFDEARRAHLRVLEAAEGSGDRQASEPVYGDLLFLCVMEGSPEAGEEWISRYLGGLTANQKPHIRFLAMAAWSILEANRDDAVERAAELIAAAEDRHDPMSPLMDMSEGLMLARRERWQEAIEALERGIAEFRRTEMLPYEGMIVDAYGDVLARKGDAEGARRKWEEALAMFQTMEAHAYVWRIQKRLASLPAVD